MLVMLLLLPSLIWCHGTDSAHISSAVSTFAVQLAPSTMADMLLAEHYHHHLTATTHVAALTDAAVATLRLHPGVVSVTEVEPGAKVPLGLPIAGAHHLHALLMPRRGLSLPTLRAIWTRRTGGVPGLELATVSKHKAVFRCKPPRCHPASAAGWLAQQGEVYYVEPRTAEHFRLANRWASGIGQGGAPNASTVWSAGLQGQGQIVGCSDTGIDIDNCLYWDHNTGQMPFQYEVANPAQRKILLYITKHGDEAPSRTPPPSMSHWP